MTRVFITGAGVASPIGCGLAEFFSALHAGLRGIDHISCFDTTRFPTRLGAEVRTEGKVICTEAGEDRKALFIQRALNELAAHSALARYPEAQRRLILGTGIDDFDFPTYVNDRHTSSSTPSVYWSCYSRRAHRIVANLAKEMGFAAGHLANVAACVASSQALGLALRSLRHEPNTAVVSGGFDSMLSYLHYMGFYQLGALSNWEGDPRAACRPFDKRRCGLVIGEGAASFLLESEAHAARENRLCELAGYAATMDAYRVTDPDPNGTALAKAALAAIKDAGIHPEDIDVVDLHGTGTVKNALAEVAALKQIFPVRYREIPVFALKGQIGHLIGACGAMEVLGVIDMLREQRVLASVNCEEADPEIPLNIVRGAPLPCRINTVLKLNAAFGGQNTALVLKRAEI